MDTFLLGKTGFYCMSNIVAVIPALEDENGLPNRNLREIKGISLVEIAIRQATNSSLITETVLNSESDAILSKAEGYDVMTYSRPDRFAKKDQFMEMDRLLMWQIDQLENDGHDVDILVLLYPICPLRTIEKIDQTIQRVRGEEYNSALTLFEDTRYLWEKSNGEVVPTNYDPQKRAPSQLEDWNQWVENKAVYAVEKETLFQTGSRVGGKTGYIEMPQYRSFDIRSEVEFELVRFISEVDGVSW